LAWRERGEEDRGKRERERIGKAYQRQGVARSIEGGGVKKREWERKRREKRGIRVCGATRAPLADTSAPSAIEIAANLSIGTVCYLKDEMKGRRRGRRERERRMRTDEFCPRKEASGSMKVWGEKNRARA